MFTRQNNDWEMKKVGDFFKRQQRQAIRKGVQDVMTWQVSKGGTFTVKSFYSSLACCNLKVFPQALCGTLRSRGGLIFWLGKLYGRIIILDQLKRKGWCLSSRYYLCKEEEALANHILLHYPKVAMLWQLIFALFGVQCMMSSSIKDALLQLVWCLRREEKEEGVESNFFVLILDLME